MSTHLHNIYKLQDYIKFMVKNPYNPKVKIQGTQNKMSSRKVNSTNSLNNSKDSVNSTMNNNSNNVYNKNVEYSKRAQGHNPIEARELELYVESDGVTYQQRLEPIYKNLAKKQQKGTYDREKAIKVYKYAVDDSAKRYEKELGSGQKIYSSADKWEVAKRLEASNRDELENYL